jgi:hypothetical protein
VHFSGKSSTGEFLTYFCCIFIIIGVVTFTVCFSLQEKYKDEVVKQHSEGFDWWNESLMVRPSMPAEAEKHTDGEM